MLPRTDLKYWVALNRFQKFGPIRFQKLIRYFPDMRAAFLSHFDDLLKAGIEEEIASEFLAKKPEINPDQELELMSQHKISAVTLQDQDYPPLLKEIYQAPPILYYKGSLQDERDNFAVSVVGTRKISSYGRRVTPDIISGLVNSGLSIVSGLALGIDSLAHEAVCQMRGRTVAVLGSGLDSQNIYPSVNRYLVKKIEAASGLIISEYPIGTPPLKHHFPYRNRIISGLTRGTIVVEAPEDSGALLTARYALEQNREVFAVPGDIYQQNSLGPNNLIKMGAKAVTSFEDVLEALNLKIASQFIKARETIPDSKEEAVILKILSENSLHIDELIRLSQLDSGTVNSTLTLMEMKGRVRNLGGMRYATN